MEPVVAVAAGDGLVDGGVHDKQYATVGACVPTAGAVGATRRAPHVAAT